MVKLIVDMKNNKVVIENSEAKPIGEGVNEFNWGDCTLTLGQTDRELKTMKVDYDFDPEGFVIELVDTTGHTWSAEIV